MKEEYILIKSLGQGSYGKVNLYDYNGMKFAIKWQNRDAIHAIMVEISLYSLMSHPNILKPVEYIQQKDSTGIVMPYFEYTMEKIIPIYVNGNVFRSLAFQCISAMEYIHINNIVHCDIKPENILIGGLTCILSDFGIARYRYENKGIVRTDLIATISHRPPELFSSDLDTETYTNSYLKSVDIWAMGLVLGDLYIGKHLLKEKTNNYSESKLRYYMQKKGSITDLYRQYNCADFILKMLDYDYKERMNYKDIKNEYFQTRMMDKQYKIPMIKQYNHEIIIFPQIDRSCFNKNNLQKYMKGRGELGIGIEKYVSILLCVFFSSVGEGVREWFLHPDEYPDKQEECMKIIDIFCRIANQVLNESESYKLNNNIKNVDKEFILYIFENLYFNIYYY